MLRQRSFWIILLLSGCVWIVSTLSMQQEYPTDIRIRWTGFDRARYVVAQCDTVLPVVVHSNGFNAIARYFALQRKDYVLKTQGDTTVVVDEAMLMAMMDTMGFVGVHGITSRSKSVALHLNERHRKAFVPQLRDVEFLFHGHSALAGEPVMKPDTVWLYGSDASLAKINGLYTQAATIGNISSSVNLRLALEPVWRKYPDVRSSTDSVSLSLPVANFTEKEVVVPLHFDCDNKNLNVNVYPPRVVVTLWVPSDRYQEVASDMVEGRVELDSRSMPETLPVMVTRFPSYARIHSIKPENVKYVVIK